MALKAIPPDDVGVGVVMVRRPAAQRPHGAESHTPPIKHSYYVLFIIRLWADNSESVCYKQIGTLVSGFESLIFR